MLNSCAFQGRLAADPELRTTQTGKTVTSFRMAVDRDMVDANGRRPTDWLTFTAWGKTAEFVSKYFRKGSAAVVHSRCQTRQFEDKNGNNRLWWTTSILRGRSRKTSKGPWMMAGRTRHRPPTGTSSRSPSRWVLLPRASASNGRARPIIPVMFRSVRTSRRVVTMISQFWTMPTICRSKEVR